MKKNKKSQAVLYIFFMISAIIIVVIAAVLAPMGVQFNTAMYEAGEEILADSQPYIDDINDASVRSQINQSVNAALDAGTNNIEVNAAIFQYGWVLVLIVSGVVFFLWTRRLIEVGAGGFV